MSYAVKAKCDRCGREKGEANKWLVGMPTHHLSDPGYTLYDWTETIATIPNAHHLCSEKCALLMLMKFIRLDEVATDYTAALKALAYIPTEPEVYAIVAGEACPNVPLKLEFVMGPPPDSTKRVRIKKEEG